MEVILDANILIADLWLQSQRIRFLLDYLAKTNSQLWLLEPVEMEVRAYAQRHFREPLVNAQASLLSAQRRRIPGIPELDVDALTNHAVTSWLEHFEGTMKRANIRLSLREAVLPEAMRRAVNRIAPCSAEGEQLRDAVIWLNILEYCTERASHEKVAFISANIKDFAAADKRSLHPQLQQDLAERNLNVAYYTSLDEFLQDHAEPIRHITLDWILDRVDQAELESLLRDHLRMSGDRYFRPSFSYTDEYEIDPYAIPYIFPFSVEINEFHVWRFQEGHIEISLICSAVIEADIECRRIHPVFGYESEWDENERVLTCAAEVGADFALDVANDEVEVRELEDCYRL